MPRHNVIDGVEVPFSQAEEDARDTEEAAWEDDAVPRNAMAEIRRLESEVTQRRLRDAYADSTWMDAQEAKIAVERAKL